MRVVVATIKLGRMSNEAAHRSTGGKIILYSFSANSVAVKSQKDYQGQKGKPLFFIDLDVRWF